jgi:hypothetical protein
MKSFMVKSALILLVGSMTVNGQNKAFDNVFNKYALKEGFVTVDISGDLFNLLFSNGEGAKKLSIGNIKLLTVEDKALHPGLNFHKEIVSKLPLNEYHNLMEIKNGEEQIVIYKRKKTKDPQEFIVVGGGNDNFMLYIEGSINFEDVISISQEIGPENVSYSKRK